MRDVTMLIVSSASWSFAGFVGESINLDISTEQIYSVAQEERMPQANLRFSVPAVPLLEKRAAGLSFLVASAIGSAQTDSRDLDLNAAYPAFVDKATVLTKPFTIIITV